MATHFDRRSIGATDGTRRDARVVAIGAALVTAALYMLIGFQVVSIGQSSQGGTPDLLGFGLTLGGAFVAAALLLALVQRRIAWIAVGVIDLVAIVGYFAMANLREPSFEIWGLLTKAAQLVLLGALVYLAVTRPAAGNVEVKKPGD